MNVEEIIKTSVSLPPERRTIIHLFLVYNRMNDALTSALKPFGISLQQFNVLRILRGQKGKPANLSTLNERMIHKMSNTTRLVDKLLAKEYVLRKTCPSNRRKVEISLTEKGQKALEEMDQAIDMVESKLMKDLSPSQLGQLNMLLNQIK
jgi:DNA-binding MarR family transcriptional regulator